VFVKDKAKVARVVVREESCILESCLSPTRRNSVLEELNLITDHLSLISVPSLSRTLFDITLFLQKKSND